MIDSPRSGTYIGMPFKILFSWIRVNIFVLSIAGLMVDFGDSIFCRAALLVKFVTSWPYFKSPAFAQTPRVGGSWFVGLYLRLLMPD